MLEIAQGSGLPPQLDTRGTMAALLVRARGSRPGPGFHRDCIHIKGLTSARNIYAFLHSQRRRWPGGSEELLPPSMEPAMSLNLTKLVQASTVMPADPEPSYFWQYPQSNTLPFAMPEYVSKADAHAVRTDCASRGQQHSKQIK